MLGVHPGQTADDLRYGTALAFQQSLPIERGPIQRAEVENPGHRPEDSRFGISPDRVVSCVSAR